MRHLESNTIGDSDEDHVEMCLYDSYRQLDGEEHAQNYLLKMQI